MGESDPVMLGPYWIGLPLGQAIATAAAGIVGFRLRPDSSWYATGHLLPSPVGGALGIVGGMPLLVAVSAIAAAACVYLLPGRRSRLLFLALGGFWLLFPGVDALGVLAVALIARRGLGAKWWPLILPIHAIAAIAALPMVVRRRWTLPGAMLLPALVAVVFVVLGRHDQVGVVEHAVYLTRYLLPAAWLAAAKLDGAAVGRWASPVLGEGTAHRRASPQSFHYTYRDLRSARR